MSGFRIKYDNNTINHLGIQLYSSFPPVIAELVSNAYDAEAEEVIIKINYSENSVSIKDNGHGMTHDEINDCFLVIGRNRRKDNDSGLSKNGKRFVTGKKGLGKLAVFGIANIIEVTSVADNKINSFQLNYTEMKNSKENSYTPTVLKENEETQLENSTIIIIKEIFQKNITNIDDLALSLSSRFNFYAEDFSVILVSDKNQVPMPVTKNLYFEDLKKEFIWKFPADFEDDIPNNAKLKFLKDNHVYGEIYTKSTPLQKKDCGFILYARKKLASQNTFFDDRSNDHFNSYATGFFNIDFIDDSDEIDLIATARQSILWEQNEETKELKIALNALVNKINTDWKSKRSEKKSQELEFNLPTEFWEGLSPDEKKNIENIKNSLLKNSVNIDNYEPIISVLNSVKNMYQFETFKEYVLELNNDQITMENIEKISNDWQQIEYKELAKIATGRIEAINKFREFISGNASETKVIQPFLEKFPWILDPRITTFEREVTFSRILKEQFPDEKLEGPNKRIDFLCNAVNGELIIIELKRPCIKISTDEIFQTQDYRDFILSKYENKFSAIHTYLISDRFDMGQRARNMYESFKNDNKLIITSYSELLVQAIQYNQEFISQYELISEKKPK